MRGVYPVRTSIEVVATVLQYPLPKVVGLRVGDF